MVDSEERRSDLSSSASHVPAIQLRGVRVNNLKSIDLNIPLGRLVVLFGPTGSGKTSLGIQTLFVESQRRFLQGVSFATRQYLQQFEEPDFDSIDQLPPTVACLADSTRRSRYSTVGTLCGAYDLLRNLFAKYGQLRCPDCGASITTHSVQSATAMVKSHLAGVPWLIVTPLRWMSRSELSVQLANLQQRGFLRIVVAGRLWHVGRDQREALSAAIEDQGTGWIVIDRVRRDDSEERITEAFEAAFLLSDEIAVLVPVAPDRVVETNKQEFVAIGGEVHKIQWLTRTLSCIPCHRQFALPSFDLFNYRRSTSACARCRGRNIVDTNMAMRAPDTSVSERPLPLHRQECPECLGTRLNASARSFEWLGYSLVDWLRSSVNVLLQRLDPSKLQQDFHLGGSELALLIRRLEALQFFGLGELPLMRGVEQISHGEWQCLRIVGCSSSDLTGLLYIFDEPTLGLDERRIQKFVEWAKRLRDLGNTVLLITNQQAILQAADWSIELGPGSGDAGGQVIHAGPAPIHNCSSNLAAANWMPDLTLSNTNQSRTRAKIVPKNWLYLSRVQCKNLHDAKFAIPLGCLCLVRGPIGSGKTAFVVDTLFPLLRSRIDKREPNRPCFATLTATTEIRDVVLIDCEPFRMINKMTVVNLVGVYDDIRKVFAELPSSKSNGFSLNHFSLHHQLGACPDCQGQGRLSVDMQFLTNLNVSCPGCQGQRFRPEVLKATYRGLSIAQVLNLTIDHSISFFRAEEKIQKRLKEISQFGLGYLQLGQRLSELSSADISRVKLASTLAKKLKPGSLFLFDQATIGLTDQELMRFIDVMDQLVAQGHSVVAIDPHPMFLQRADHIIDQSPTSLETTTRSSG